MTTEQFYSLPKEQRAVLVAKDVLAQIKKEKYIPTRGNYITIKKIKNVKSNSQINKSFSKIKECEVCALGSMLMSCTHLGNRLTFKDIYIDLEDELEEYGYAASLINNSVTELFKEIFDFHSLLLIETAFEGYSDWMNLDEEQIEMQKENWRYAEEAIRFAEKETLSYKECVAAHSLYNRHIEDEEGALREICLNIIKNKGKFIL